MFKTTEEGFAWFESFTNLEKMPDNTKREYRLDRMEKLSELFGRPERSFKTIHLAGSKGKGSTAVFIASMLAETGRKTGLYTSPHVVSYSERIKILDEPDNSGILLDLFGKIQTITESPDCRDLPGGLPTTFELLTLLAFLYFREMKCDYAVIETGLGGRLDATNIVVPEAVVFTPVELEHTDILGSTLEEITAEKGGIIKPGVPVFSSEQQEPVLEALRNRAAENESTFYYLPDFARVTELKLTLAAHVVRYNLFDGNFRMKAALRMLGKKQIENSALALLVLKIIFPFIKTRYLRKGMSRAFLPARMEKVREKPFVLLDAAHTRESVKGAMQLFKNLPVSGTRVLVFGCLKDKDAAGMAAVLAPAFQNIIITTPGYYRESNTDEIFNLFIGKNPATLLLPDPKTAYRTALSLAGDRGGILVTGSFYLAGAVRRVLNSGE